MNSMADAIAEIRADREQRENAQSLKENKMSYELRNVLNEVEAEVTRAMSRFPAMRSAHEGEAIVREEADEFTQAVRHGTGSEAYHEAKQVAAMAIRFMCDVGANGSEKPNDGAK